MVSQCMKFTVRPSLKHYLGCPSGYRQDLAPNQHWYVATWERLVVVMHPFR